MPIIDPLAPVAAPAAPPSRAAMTKLEMDADINQLNANMAAVYRRCMDRVWRNKLQVAPQDVLNEYGPDATALFAMAGDIASLINKHNPGLIQPDPNALSPTFNPDGTVTLADPPAPQPPAQ